MQDVSFWVSTSSFNSCTHKTNNESDYLNGVRRIYCQTVVVSDTRIKALQTPTTSADEFTDCQFGYVHNVEPPLHSLYSTANLAGCSALSFTLFYLTWTWLFFFSSDFTESIEDTGEKGKYWCLTAGGIRSMLMPLVNLARQQQQPLPSSQQKGSRWNPMALGPTKMAFLWEVGKLDVRDFWTEISAIQLPCKASLQSLPSLQSWSHNRRLQLA